MLDARDHLLPDIAALPEIDAAELVHVGFMRERVAIDEIHAAARHAERDAVRVIGLGVGQRRAEVGGGLGGEFGWQDGARAERGKARIGIGQAVFAQARTVPHGHHAERRREVLGEDLGAQFVEIELCQGLPREPSGIEKKAAAIRPVAFGGDQIHNDLALRGQQRSKNRHAGATRPISLVVSPLRKFRASSPATLTLRGQEAALPACEFSYSPLA